MPQTPYYPVTNLFLDHQMYTRMTGSILHEERATTSLQDFQYGFHKGQVITNLPSSSFARSARRRHCRDPSRNAASRLRSFSNCLPPRLPSRSAYRMVERRGRRKSERECFFLFQSS